MERVLQLVDPTGRRGADPTEHRPLTTVQSGLIALLRRHPIHAGFLQAAFESLGHAHGTIRKKHLLDIFDQRSIAGLAHPRRDGRKRHAIRGLALCTRFQGSGHGLF